MRGGPRKRYLTAESKLERARTAIRNFVAYHLSRRDEKEAALVAFVSPTEATWRFSYVKMEYASIPTDSGNVGLETRLTRPHVPVSNRHASPDPKLFLQPGPCQETEEQNQWA